MIGRGETNSVVSEQNLTEEVKAAVGAVVTTADAMNGLTGKEIQTLQLCVEFPLISITILHIDKYPITQLNLVIM